VVKAIRYIAGGLLAAVVALPTGSAFATTVRAYNGDGELVATAWSPVGKHGEYKGTVGLRDESGGNWVKAEYYRARNNDKHTLWNKSGKGVRVYSNSGSKIVKLQVCEDIDWGSDHCSGWSWVS